MFAIGNNSRPFVLGPGQSAFQVANVPKADHLVALVAMTLVMVDNSANPTDVEIEILPPGTTASMPSYQHAVPTYPVHKTVKANSKEVITLPELFSTAEDNTVVPPVETPQPPIVATSYQRGVKNLSPTATITATVSMVGVGFPIDWAGTTAPWFTWGRC